MTTQPIITVLSTEARDRLLDEQGHFVREERGGPVKYITRTLQEEDVFYSMPTPPVCDVEMKITKEGEVGRVTRSAPPVSFDFIECTTPYLLISTILDDYVLDTLGPLKGTIFFDVQGYVRDGRAGRPRWSSGSRSFVRILSTSTLSSRDVQCLSTARSASLAFSLSGSGRSSTWWVAMSCPIAGTVSFNARHWIATATARCRPLFLQRRSVPHRSVRARNDVPFVGSFDRTSSESFSKNFSSTYSPTSMYVFSAPARISSLMSWTALSMAVASTFTSALDLSLPLFVVPRFATSSSLDRIESRRLPLTRLRSKRDRSALSVIQNTPTLEPSH